MSTVTITVRFDVKCAECGKPGACDNTLCVAYSAAAMRPTKPMQSAAGRAVQQRWARIRSTRQ